MALFQSTLPRGSDGYIHWLALQGTISIHAPSRERLSSLSWTSAALLFQSTLPRGSDTSATSITINQFRISIHAPSRERLSLSFGGFKIILYFNPRSLAGATGMPDHRSPPPLGISIHAPSRERPLEMLTSKSLTHFNPRSLAGATAGQSV